MNQTATTEKEQNPLDLILSVEEDPGIVFKDDSEITAESLFKAIMDYESKFNLNLATKTGRTEITGRALRVSKIKTALENAGKKLTEDHRKYIASVNAKRTEFKDKLEEARDAIRRPVDNWEAQEEARQEQHKATGERIADLGTVSRDDTSETVRAKLEELRSIDTSETAMQEFAGFAAKRQETAIKALEEILPRLEQEEADRRELDRLRAEQEERQQALEEQQRKAAEDRRIREEAEAAAAEAARKAQEDADRRVREAQEEADRKVREAQEEAARQQAAMRRQQEEEAAARLAEEQRKQAEADRERQEAEARARDAQHRKDVNADVATALVEAAGIDQEQADLIVQAIASGRIPALTIGY